MRKKIAAAAVALLMATGAYALGTDAGTVVSNFATLSYSAGGVQQPDVNSSTDTFVVDKKIDLILVTTDTAQTSVTPNQQDRLTNYEFRNEGNADQNFTFSVANLPSGQEADYNNKQDSNDVNNLEIQCADGSNTYGWSSSLTIEVAEDANLTCQVRADIPDASNASDGDVMNVELVATAVDSNGQPEQETNGADTQNSVDIVFADGVSDSTLGESGGGKGDTAKDGKDVARSGYIVQTPVLSATKTSCVIDDPVNGTNDPKRIPGATIRYMFDIQNTGSAAVSDLNLTDTFSNDLDLTGTQNSARKVESQNNACQCTSPGSTDISGDTTISGQQMTIEHLNVAAGNSQTQHTCVSVETVIK